MPRQTTIRCSTTNGLEESTYTAPLEREYTVTYLDDPPERREAVAFFQEFDDGLFPAIDLPSCIDDLPFDQAQKYLDEHPMQERWSMLTITEGDPICDEDLARLQYLPELEIVKIYTSKISDCGIAHLKWLVSLECLILSSKRLTNACLQHIVRISSLQAVDMQRASQVTRDAYMEAMDQLPNLSPERYPPFDEDSPY